MFADAGVLKPNGAIDVTAVALIESKDAILHKTLNSVVQLAGEASGGQKPVKWMGMVKSGMVGWGGVLTQDYRPSSSVLLTMQRDGERQGEGRHGGT